MTVLGAVIASEEDDTSNIGDHSSMVMGGFQGQTKGVDESMHLVLSL